MSVLASRNPLLNERVLLNNDTLFRHGIENLTPCKRHLVYLRQLRNIPLEKPVDIPGK